MTARPPPTLAEQIDAVEWAENKARAMNTMGKRGGLSADRIKDLTRRLEAAAETLRTLDFGSAIAR
jgi:hypothetical protein